ncbi:MAG: ABC transporter ATP-binding protein [Acidimicrobiales bacterium]|nr:ABC transporter ATP-binding protein [Acidimicrobiales bacterium]
MVDQADPKVERIGEYAIDAVHLTKKIGQRVAFDDLSFQVQYGEVFGFLGPNGAGKTTTVRTLGTLLAPTSGSANVVGIELNSQNSVEIRSRISIMPESPGLYNRLSVEENLECFADLYMLKDAKEQISVSLEAVNLSSRRNDLCGTLSKGLRQRVGLARALLNDPKLLFLDEPTSGLDPIAALEVHELIINLKQRGVTIFLTTHRLDEAEKLCDRVAILNTTLKMIGRTNDLRNNMFAKSMIVKTLNALESPAAVFEDIEGVTSWEKSSDGSFSLNVTSVESVAPNVTRALVKAGADVIFIGEAHHSLEDVYLEIVGADGGGNK